MLHLLILLIPPIPPALGGTSAVLVCRLWLSKKTLARFSWGSNCEEVESQRHNLPCEGQCVTNIVGRQVLDAPPVFAGKLHDIALEPTFSSIA